MYPSDLFVFLVDAIRPSVHDIITLALLFDLASIWVLALVRTVVDFLVPPECRRSTAVKSWSENRGPCLKGPWVFEDFGIGLHDICCVAKSLSLTTPGTGANTNANKGICSQTFQVTFALLWEHGHNLRKNTHFKMTTLKKKLIK